MLSRNQPDRIQITFDDDCSFRRHRPARRSASRNAPGRANAGDKISIDDADEGGRPAAGRHGQGAIPWAPFLRSFRWGVVGQLDRVSRELLAHGPGRPGQDPATGPLTIDLDSTICETYGLAKEGARHHGYTGKRGYHPLLAIAAGIGAC